jgi:hypothetical protein
MQRGGPTSRWSGPGQRLRLKLVQPQMLAERYHRLPERPGRSAPSRYAPLAAAHLHLIVDMLATGHGCGLPLPMIRTRACGRAAAARSAAEEARLSRKHRPPGSLLLPARVDEEAGLPVGRAEPLEEGLLVRAGPRRGSEGREDRDQRSRGERHCLPRQAAASGPCMVTARLPEKATRWGMSPA